jgi:hypothetical protein
LTGTEHSGVFKLTLRNMRLNDAIVSLVLQVALVHVLAITSTRLTSTQEFGRTERSNNSLSRAKRFKTRNHKTSFL